jgi:rhamnosyltransferase
VAKHRLDFKAERGEFYDRLNSKARAGKTMIHRKIKLAIIGARGIGNYGGFETVVSELAPRLVERGYVVYSSCEKSGNEEQLKEYKGVKLIYFPIKPPANYTLRKIFEIIYDIYFITKCSLFCDVVFALGIGGGIFLFVPRLFGKVSIVNIDGLEWKRSKFDALEKALLRILLAFSFTSATFIGVDNKCLKNYINPRYHRKVIYVPYGVSPHEYIPWDGNKLIRYFNKKDVLKISPGKFWLVVARLESENNIHIIIEAFTKAKIQQPLVIIGDFTSNKCRDEIYKMITDSELDNIILLGSVYNIDILDMLRQNCFAYFHGHSVGGTNPSLLEAMIMKNIIIAHDNEFNREVGGDTIFYFSDAEELAELIKSIENNYSKYSKLKQITFSRVSLNYSWNKIIDKYDSLFKLIY